MEAVPVLSAETSKETFHPLDPLGAYEFRAVAAALAREHGVGQGWRINAIELAEPSKEQIAAFENSGTVPERTAIVVCYERATNKTFKGLISLTDDASLSWDHIPGVQPNFTVDEWEEADAYLRSHPDVIAALEKRGITDMSLVFMDVWTYGEAVMPEKYRGRRLGWSDTWVKARQGANPYANPVTGLHCVLDVATMELLEIENGEPVPPPNVMGEYIPDQVPAALRESSTRPPLTRLDITQPDGPSFTLTGNKLEWQGWSMRLGFNYREGMTLHQVGFDDHGRRRSIAHRLSFAEMAVPYRDPGTDHYRRTAFDIGEWGLGFMTTSLELGCDCLGEIRYVDAILHDSAGEPFTITNAVCIHEVDNAILWKHIDHDTGSESRRMRRLTVSCHVTVANYEYLVYWHFDQAGGIECEVRATGIMVTTSFPEGGEHPNGTLVDDRTYAPYHQHFLIARLDLDIDGTENTVYCSETETVPTGPDNPHGLGLVQRNTPLRTEEEGKQDPNWHTQRAWKVVNENVVNGLGTHPAYKLVPSGSFPSMFDPASPVFRRMQATGHTLWVTPNAPDERWPSGEFVVQSRDDDGLPAWTAANRPIENTDVVLWYVFGIHHITRPEDWPIMPVDTVSFKLLPFGFFDRNPALDVVEPAEPSCSGHHSEHQH